MTYTTEAIACGLSDVAGWLENEGGRDKHARTIRLGVERLRELGAASGGEGFVLVPRTATNAMTKAGDDFEYDGFGDYYGQLWAAMADAVPAAPSHPGEAEAPATRKSDGGARILAGLEDAVAYVQGDTSRATLLTVKDGEIVEPHPGEADRIGLGELERLLDDLRAVANRISERNEHASGAHIYDTVNRIERLAATYLVPSSVPALSTGEGSGGAGWMPIETAPKDGTKFDAWAVHPATGSMGVRFADVQTRGDGTGFGVVIHRPGAHWEYLEQDGPTYPAWKLTHWRPCPDSPSPLPHPQAPNTLSEMEEARAFIGGLLADDGPPYMQVNMLRYRADLATVEAHRNSLRAKADRIEAALATLRASQEQDGEVHDV